MTLVVDKRAFVLRLQFCSIVAVVGRWVAEFFINSSNCMYGWARYRTSLQRVMLYFTRCLYNGWVTRSPLMNERTNSSLLELLLWLTVSKSSQCILWGCRRASSWWRGGDGCSAWTSDKNSIEQEITWWDPRNYELSMAEGSRTNRRLLPSSRRGRSVT